MSADRVRYYRVSCFPHVVIVRLDHRSFIGVRRLLQVSELELDFILTLIRERGSVMPSP